MLFEKGNPWSEGMEDFSDKTPYMITIDGARMAHFIPEGTVWAGEVWWWMFTRKVARG